jgi:hypothetical protein
MLGSMKVSDMNLSDMNLSDMKLGDITRIRPAIWDITKKSADHPPPWSEVFQQGQDKQPPWEPRKLPPPGGHELEPEPAPWSERREPEDEPPSFQPSVQRRTREFPRGLPPGAESSQERKEKPEGSWWVAKLRRWLCSRRRRERQVAEASEALLGSPDMGEEERRVRRITPSCYNAMEIHGFFGLVDDGPCSSGRMLIVHQPSWVRGHFLDIRDGDDIHVWHVSGTAGGVLRVLSTGRHRYYSPGQRVTTCTVCVPEEQWERLMQ